MPYKNIDDKRAWSRRYSKLWRAKNYQRALRNERRATRKRQKENPEQVRAWRRDFYWRHRERLRVERQPYLEARKPIKAAYDKRYAKRHRIKKKRYLQQWYQANKLRQNAYCRMRRATDPQYAIANTLRTRMNSALRNGGLKRDIPLEMLIGCTVQQLMMHLATGFKRGMSWMNRSLWHIDHIRPCAKFDLRNRDEQLKCFHFTNLQPLWAHENISKSDKV